MWSFQLVDVKSESRNMATAEMSIDEQIEERIWLYKEYIVECVLASEILGLLDFIDKAKKQELTQLQRQKGDIKAMETLLDVIKETHVPEKNKWSQFVNSLDVAEYEYLAKTLRGFETDSSAISDSTNHRRLIELLGHKIKKKLDPVYLIQSLHCYGVINKTDMEEIFAERYSRGNIAASVVLLDRVPRRHKDWFYLFLQAIHEAEEGEQDELINSLDSLSLEKYEAKKRDDPSMQKYKPVRKIQPPSLYHSDTMENYASENEAKKRADPSMQKPSYNQDTMENYASARTMATGTSDDERLREKIDVYRLVLMKYVIPTQLLPSLTDVLSGQDDSTVRNLTHQRGNKEGTEYLLNVLVKKTEILGRWRMLVNALKQHGYEDLSMILEGKMDMIDRSRDRNKRIIDIFRVPLQKGIKPLDILPSLKQKGVLSQDDQENISAEDCNQGSLAASALLLDRIDRKKSNWYDLFLESLAENNYGHLAEKIDPDFMKKWTIRNEEVLYQRGEPSDSSTMENYQSGTIQNEEVLYQRGETSDSSTMENYQSDYGEAMTDLKGLNLSPNPQLNDTLDTNDTTTVKKEESLNSTEKDSAAVAASTDVKLVQQTSREPTEHDELSGPSQDSTPKASGAHAQSEPVASASPGITPHSDETIGSGLSLYRYQEELARPGLEGHNSIVVAPTNSGKTHVAIRIIQHHLTRGEGKVIFLVPTSALATQQRDRCQELLKCPVKVMTGESQAKEKYVDMSVHLKNHDVIVATPQLLVNCLSAEDDVTMQTFSLIVFDECHRTYEYTPYNIVMRIYWDEKLTSEHVRLPQILGMTASLGSGQANSQSSANEWVKNIMANMDSQKLVTVKENIEELERNINNTDTEIVVTPERSNKIFGRIINDMMATIEGNINLSDVNLKRPPLLRSGAPYTVWCSTLRKQVKNTVDDDLHRRLKIYVDYLEVYHRALLIYEDARVSDAIRYLKEEFEEMYFEDTAVETDHEMKNLFQEKQQQMQDYDDGDQENPKLREVQTRICDIFRDDPDSRAIIYVKTIELARSMEAWMNECPALQHLKAKRFVGAHARVGIGGITKVEQDTILKAFRNGDHKVVVGTSVLEEGLDVPRCNLVILYDHVTNEIQRVQTRGRIRRDNSHFVLIVSESGKAAEKEFVNERRESMSSEAVRLVQDEISRDPHGFYERQQAQQLEEKRKRDAIVLEEKKQLENNPVYEVKCNHCRSLLFLSSDLRKIKVHHTVVARGMNDKLSSGPRGRPSFVDKDMEHGIAELYCKTCMIFIGSVNKSMSLYFPMPRIDQITFIKNDDYKTCKKWKDVKKLFGIKSFCPIEDMRFIIGLPEEEREFYTL